MLREALAAHVDQDVAEALLRYYVRKKSHTAFDRDKTDFVVSFLYRHPRVPGQWDTRGYSMDGVAPMPPFEIALLEIFDDAELAAIPAEQLRIFNEFDYLRDELEAIDHFDALMESGLIAKGRELKESLGAYFYHPHVLAGIAAHNAVVAGKFAQLFGAAATHIKSFAAELQQNEGSSQVRIDGDITVKQLAEVREAEILKTEYIRAQDQLRHVARLKKAVDSRKSQQRRASTTAVATGAVSHARAAAASASPAALGASSPRPAKTGASAAASMAAPDTAESRPAQGIHGKEAEEEHRLRSVQDSIRSFVRAADPKFRQVVPLRFGNFVLSAAEADAYCADYLEESSFRGDNARVLVRLPAIVARMAGEMEQLQQHQGLKYLWRPHAEALGLLVNAAALASNEAQRVIQLASQRGLAEKVKALSASLQKLDQSSQQVRTMLAHMSGRD